MPSSEALVVAPSRVADPGRGRKGLLWLAVGLVVVSAAWMTIDVGGQWSFVLPRRGIKLAGLSVVGAAIGVSAVLFQTITNNRILTPSLMGFDRLFALMQTSAVFLLGSQTLGAVDPRLQFVAESGVLVAFSVLLFRWIFGGEGHGLYTLVLVGIVFGTLFSSVSSLMVRVIDPNEFDSLQDRLFVSFNRLDTSLLAGSALIVAVVGAWAWRHCAEFDVLSLGREPAIGLGVDYRRAVIRVLIMVTLLVAVSTALVGPVAFLGLLVANLAYQIASTYRHRVLLPAAAIIGAIALVGGQTILERVFAFNATLGSIIDVVGGVYLIVLLIREAAE